MCSYNQTALYSLQYLRVESCVSDSCQLVGFGTQFCNQLLIFCLASEIPTLLQPLCLGWLTEIFA